MSDVYCEDYIKLISHRGNISGPNPDHENSPKYLHSALLSGFLVELDVWNINDVWFLGHDYPKYKIDIDWLTGKRSALLCHAKNVTALQFLLKNNYHCFWHENDDYTLTNKGIPICYPNRSFFEGCILMKVEHFANPILQPCWGICSDYISLYK